MSQRQEQPHGLILAQRELRHVLESRIHGEHEVRMRQLNALGRAGGTGCVDDCGEHVAMRGGAAFLELCVRHPFAQFLDGADRAGLQHVDVAQRGAFVLDGHDLVTLCIRAADHALDGRIVADHLDLRR